MSHKSTSKNKQKCINKNGISNRHINNKFLMEKLSKKSKSIINRKFKSKLLWLNRMLRGINMWFSIRLRWGRKLLRDGNREEFLSKFKSQPNKVNLSLPIREVSSCKFKRNHPECLSPKLATEDKSPSKYKILPRFKPRPSCPDH